MVYCSAVNCKSNSSARTKEDREGISFYRLPRDNTLKKTWLNNMKRENAPKDDSIRLCHLHFEEQCFERDLKVLYTVLVLLHICFIILESA